MYKYYGLEAEKKLMEILQLQFQATWNVFFQQKKKNNYKTL